MKVPRPKNSHLIHLPTPTPAPHRFMYRLDDRLPKIMSGSLDQGDHTKLLAMKKTFNLYPGDSEVILVLWRAQDSAIRLPFTARAAEELKVSIAELYGPDSIKFR